MNQNEQEKTNQAVGKQTIRFACPPAILSRASIVGDMEGQGPLASYFDQIEPDPACGMASWEEGESEMVRRAVQTAITKSGIAKENIRYIFGGDLLGQLIGSTFGLKDFQIPIFGLYGACSTMAEALCLAALCAAAGYAHEILAMSSSHFCAAERQFRTPLSYGAVRTPTAQWTATAAGCCLLHPAGQGVGIAAATFGRVEDYQIKDINNMGAAMAPAAAATLLRYLHDTGQEPKEFDAVYTGDLGHLGSRLFREILTAEGLVMKNHIDCGSILYDAARQNVKSGGSGPGCCAAVLCGHILPRLERGSYRRVLFIATGALMSQTTFLQKESIPAIAHLVELRGPECTARG